MKVLSSCLVLLAIASGCQTRIPPRATAINPICLAFCSSRADIGDDSVNSVQHTYSPTKSTTTKPAKPPKPTSTTITTSPPPTVVIPGAIPGRAIPGAIPGASAPIPASAPASPLDRERGH